MSAELELSTVLALGSVSGDTPTENSVVYRLMEQWRSRHSASAQRNAWEQAVFKRVGPGLALWILQSNARNETNIPLLEISKNPTELTNEFVQLWLAQMQREADTQSTPWREMTQTAFYYLNRWCYEKSTIVDTPTVAALEAARQCLEQRDQQWCERLFSGFPKRIKDQLYTQDNGLLEQKKMVQAVRKHFNQRQSVLLKMNNTRAVKAFLQKLDNYSLEQQTQPNGIIFSTIKELLSQADAEGLRLTIAQLQHNGWSNALIWSGLNTTGLRTICHAYPQMEEYLDVVAAVADSAGHKKIFTWIVEGVVNKLPQLATQGKLLSCVTALVNKPYAKTVGRIEVNDLRDYTNFVMRTWENDPGMQKKYMNDRYARTGLSLNNSEEFVAKVGEKMCTADTHSAVAVLNARAKHPSVQGLVDFWGKLHGVDFAVEGRTSLALYPYYHSAGELDKQLWLRAKLLESTINARSTPQPVAAKRKI